MATLTYIRKQHKGYYIETQEPIDQEYWAGQIGTTYEDFLANKWVLLSKKQVQFHDLYPNASVKEVLDCQLTPRTIEQAKAECKQRIAEYDSSASVNSFIVKLTPDTEQDGETIEGQSISAWFTADERSNHKNSIDSAEILGMESLNVPLGGQMFELPVLFAKNALAQIQLYADACSLVTEGHKAAVDALTTIEEVDNYDFSTGYPAMIVFNLYEYSHE